MNYRQLFKEAFKQGYKKALNEAKLRVENNDSSNFQHDDLEPVMITNKIARDAFEHMIINLLICILDAAATKEWTQYYKPMIDPADKENTLTLVTLVRKVIKDEEDAYEAAGKFFEKAKEMTVYEMQDYWTDKYEVSPFLIDDWLQKNYAYLRGDLIRALFGKKAQLAFWKQHSINK